MCMVRVVIIGNTRLIVLRSLHQHNESLLDSLMSIRLDTNIRPFSRAANERTAILQYKQAISIIDGAHHPSLVIGQQLISTCYQQWMALSTHDRNQLHTSSLPLHDVGPNGTECITLASLTVYYWDVERMLVAERMKDNIGRIQSLKLIHETKARDVVENMRLKPHDTDDIMMGVRKGTVIINTHMNQFKSAQQLVLKDIKMIQQAIDDKLFQSLKT
jgi:hypothetical protein